jgi:hypothetical protein
MGSQEVGDGKKLISPLMTSKTPFMGIKFIITLKTGSPAGSISQVFRPQKGNSNKSLCYQKKPAWQGPTV